MEAQKSGLNESVLLIFQNTCFNCQGKIHKIILEKFALTGPMICLYINYYRWEFDTENRQSEGTV